MINKEEFEKISKEIQKKGDSEFLFDNSEYLKQLLWERNTAVETIKNLGGELGIKPEIIKKQIKEESKKEIINMIYQFFLEEIDKLETGFDGINEYYKDIKKLNELLILNKQLCQKIKEF